MDGDSSDDAPRFIDERARDGATELAGWTITVRSLLDRAQLDRHGGRGLDDEGGMISISTASDQLSP